MPVDDNHPGIRGENAPSRDPHGQAALLLVESLIHGLCESSTLSNDQAVEIVERAIDVQSEQAEAADDAGAQMWRSHALLSEILASLRIDGLSLQPRLV